ncbi:hypothetical protein ACWKTL_14895 [Bacillus toyonensis]|uniref:hypothetical protein n=1 Tax=Bacillus toyonensis TaxID=155322 RepID=UPI000B43E4A7|nr:hypothetical protein [Bacillus toyonensis]MED3198987.1 hypothetical protein [Bacillus toyonensis]OTX08248.1 hypothetical protein BK712_10760 [Bacillus thuringiensis serovar seoulensis]
MDELDKPIAYITKAIDVACNKFPKDDENQYKAFLYLLNKKANLNVNCSQERYLQLRKLFIKKKSPWREYTDNLDYDYAVKELLGVGVPIFIL